ncbi:hypothetical protein MBLNU459_g1034t1 [Dothideomycetes sp. NU459]
MGGGGEKKPGQYMGWWGSLGSPPQKGIVTYGLSNNRQRALAGTTHAAIFNTYRRTKGQILFWAIPMLIGYETMQWAQERYESLQPSSPRGLHPRSAAAAAASSQRRHNTASLKLPSLPRFHPANFPSQHSSLTNTPATGPNSPQPPTSPMAQQKLYSEAQKQLYLYQRETIAAAGRSSARERPVSPRLDPLGSPGPVTPFELEGQEGYLHAGAHGAGHHDARSKELVEKLVEEEVRRNASMAQQSHQSPSSFPVL